MSSDAALEIMMLQLLIARAAQKDSLSWWEDESLTQAGGYVLERLFPNAPQRAGWKLALEAALARHKVALKDMPDVEHLFALGLNSQEELSPINTVIHLKDLTEKPVRTMEILEERLVEAIGEPQQLGSVSNGPGGTLEIMMVAEDSKINVLDRAKALAWGYLEAEPGKPVFPYIRA
jgi:hypothetical protein